MINANLHTLSAVQQSMLQGIDEVHAASVLASRVAAQLVTQHQHLLWQNGPQHTSPYHLSAPSANHIAYNGTVHPTTFAFGTYESDKGAIEVSKVLHVACLHGLSACIALNHKALP